MRHQPAAKSLSALRVARVLRILRLLKNLKGLRDLIMTLVFAFPSLINIASLLCIVMFMYSVMGMNVFTYVLHVSLGTGSMCLSCTNFHRCQTVPSCLLRRVMPSVNTPTLR